MNYCENIKCNRINLCDYPCEPYTDYIINLSLNKGNIENKKENEIMDYNIEEFMEFSVGDPEYLQICNGLISPIQIIDFQKLRQYMIEKNEEYCKDYGLCEICHSPFIDEKQVEEYWGSRMVIGLNRICPNGCS